MEFYKIAARLIPTETASKSDTNITSKIVRFLPQAKNVPAATTQVYRTRLTDCARNTVSQAFKRIRTTYQRMGMGKRVK